MTVGDSPPEEVQKVLASHVVMTHTPRTFTLFAPDMAEPGGQGIHFSTGEVAYRHASSPAVQVFPSLTTFLHSQFLPFPGSRLRFSTGERMEATGSGSMLSERVHC